MKMEPGSPATNELQANTSDYTEFRDWLYFLDQPTWVPVPEDKTDA